MIALAFAYKSPARFRHFDPSAILYIAAIEFVLECGLFVIGVAALWYL